MSGEMNRAPSRVRSFGAHLIIIALVSAWCWHWQSKFDDAWNSHTSAVTKAEAAESAQDLDAAIALRDKASDALEPTELLVFPLGAGYAALIIAALTLLGRGEDDQ